MLGRLYRRLFAQADRLNRENILAFADEARRALTVVRRFVDLGCDDGAWTMRVARQLGATEVSGVEIVPEQADKARSLGVAVVQTSLDKELPFSTESVDVVHANQVIEHVANIDLFVSEVRRILVPGGYAIISSENGSAWHNVFAAAMGWQIFSLTNVSTKAGAVGNPLALHTDGSPVSASWTHKTIFNYRGFKEIFEVHGFNAVRIQGSGYHPLPAAVGKLDPRHSHFITALARR